MHLFKKFSPFESEIVTELPEDFKAFGVQDAAANNSFDSATEEEKGDTVDEGGHAQINLFGALRAD